MSDRTQITSKSNNRMKAFAISALALLLSLFMGAVSVFYRWPIIYVLSFTFLFALFLVLAVYIYVSVSRESKYERLLAEKDQIERAARRRTEYFANMSHEIRTPINAIMGYNELILREYNDATLRQYAGNIRSAANTLLAIVNDSLDYSRIEAGKMTLLPAEYDLGALIEGLVNMIRPRALSKQLELKSKVNEKIPRYLYGDSERLKQCIINLLTNAVKYTTEGEIVLSVDYEPLKSGAKLGKSEILLKISVKDTGRGIKKEDLEKLYRPYERIEEANNRFVEGTGLGISIVKKILGLMDSRLEVESEYGEGSNFHFCVKQEVINMDPIGDFARIYAERTVSQSVYHNRFVAPGIRILIVDEAELNLSVMEELLKDTRITIDSALSSQTGIEFASKNKYDLIFIDLKLHRNTEGKLLRFLRKADNKEDSKKAEFWSRQADRNRVRQAEEKESVGINFETPCIAMTAGELQEVQEEYLKYGFSDYLKKPIVYKELETLLLNFIPASKIRVKEKAKRQEPVLMTDEKYNEAIELLKRRENEVR